MSATSISAARADERGPAAPPSGRGEPAWELARLYPLQGEWTEADYLALDAADGRLVELSDGTLEFPPMPDLTHFNLVSWLYDRLREAAAHSGRGRTLFAPLPVRLWEGKFREPDVFWATPGRLAGPSRYPDGADLVIEVVSPDARSRERDLVTKRAEYAAAGIPEYWIVDPQTRTILVLTLDGVAAGGPYRVHGEFRPGDTATSLLLPGFAVPVDACFAAGDAVPQTVTSEPPVS